MPPSKCRVTMTGLNSRVTVHMPSVACTPTSATMEVASHGDWHSARRRHHAVTMMANIMRPSTPAI